jgi:hypothetical protein
MWIEAWLCLPYRYGLDEWGTRDTINGMQLGEDAPPGPALDENSVYAEDPARPISGC